MNRRRALRTSVSALAIAWSAMTLAGVAQAGPQGGVVVSGSASIEQSGSATVIRQQSSRADLSWASFDIGRSESVDFLQPSSSAIALNRIGGSRPSEIQGSLSANGHVWLMNPSGILFGDGAQVNVNGLMATSSRISAADFAAGNDRFAEPGGAIRNAGALGAGEGGVALVAPVIENTGRIASAGGDVTLHAGSAFSVDLHGDGLLSYVIGPEDPIATSLSNGGEIAAQGGAVRLSAAAAESVRESVVSLGGMVEATGLAEVDGEIVVTAPGQAQISGTLTARRGDAGGDVSISADQLVLHDTAHIDVSAPAGGGRVELGPRASPVPTARVAVQSGARIAADSTVDGDGGEILVWSEEGTWFNGHASAAARGAGDGGFIDISSAGGLRFTGSADLSAAAGEPGTLLFDPATITIAQPVSGGDDDAQVDDGEILFNDGGDSNFLITPGALAGVDGDILLQATQEITVQDPVTLPTQSMTLESDGVIGINAQLTLDAGDLTLDALGNIDINAGMLTELGDITVDSGVHIFVDSRVEVRGEHVFFHADGQFLQDIPFIIEGGTDPVGNDPLDDAVFTIIGDGTADGDGVDITAAEIIVAGDVQALNGGDIVLTALGGVETPGLIQLEEAGSLFVEAGDLIMDATGDGYQVSLFGSSTVGRGDVEIRADDEVRIGGLVFDESSTVESIVGSVNVGTGSILIDSGSFANLLGDVVVENGPLTVLSGSDIFVESTSEIRADRVRMDAAEQFVQASVIGAEEPSIGTIISDGTGADDGIFIEGGSVLINGSLVSDSDIGLVATGTPGGELEFDGSVRIVPQEAGTVPLQFSLSQPDAVPGGPVVAQDDVTIDALNEIRIENPVEATTFTSTAQDHTILGSILADSASLTFTESGNVGLDAGGFAIDQDELDLITADDLTIAATGTLGVETLSLDAPSEVLLQATDQVTVNTGSSLSDLNLTLESGGSIGINAPIVLATGDLMLLARNFGVEGGTLIDISAPLSVSDGDLRLSALGPDFAEMEVFAAVSVETGDLAMSAESTGTGGSDVLVDNTGSLFVDAGDLTVESIGEPATVRLFGPSTVQGGDILVTSSEDVVLGETNVPAGRLDVRAGDAIRTLFAPIVAGGPISLTGLLDESGEVTPTVGDINVLSSPLTSGGDILISTGEDAFLEDITAAASLEVHAGESILTLGDIDTVGDILLAGQPDAGGAPTPAGGRIDTFGPIGSSAGDIVVLSAADIEVLNAVIAELGDITMDSGADIFVDADVEVRGERVAFRADDEFRQDIPFEREGQGGQGMTIIGDGTADGDGVEVTAAQIFIVGDVQAINGGDIVLTALGDVETTPLVELDSAGSLFVEAGDLVIDAIGDAAQVSLFGPSTVDLGNVSISAESSQSSAEVLAFQPIDIGTGDLAIDATGQTFAVVDLFAPVSITDGDASISAESGTDIANVLVLVPLDIQTGDLTIDAATTGVTGSGNVFIRDDVTVDSGDVVLTADDLVQIGGGVFELGTIVGSLNVGTGSILIDAGAFADLLGDVVVDTGPLEVTSGGDIFVESSSETRGDRVDMDAADEFAQASVIGADPTGFTIISDGTGAGDGIFIEGGSVRITGSLDSASDIEIVAAGVPSGTLDGSVLIVPQEAGPVPLHPEFEQASGLPGGQVVAQDAISITATNTVEMANTIAGTSFESTARDYIFNAPLLAGTARIAFSGAGSIGPAENAGLNRFAVGDLTFAAEGGDLTVGSLNLEAPTFSNLTLTARDAVNVTGSLPGGGFGPAGFSPFALSFGEEAGLRPTGVNSTGRIGVEDLGGGGFALAPPSSLGFFVNGDVILDPEPKIDDGSVILHANGTTTIDVTGDFRQTNTLDPDRTEPLFNGEGGGGAVLGPVLLLSADSLRLYGTVDGLETFEAVRGVIEGPGFNPDENHLVNDCRLDRVTCLSDLGEETAKRFPVGLIDPNTLADPVLTPDVEALSGFFLDIGVIDPTLEEEEPVTNRANDEGWPP